MKHLLLRLLDILRLRSGPQDLPARWSVAIALCALYMAEGVWSDQRLGEPGDGPRSLVVTIIQFLAVWALLRWRGMLSRLPQSLAAFAGTGVIFGLASMVLIAQAQPEVNQPLLAMMWLGLFLWSLIVDGHIYRHALSITMSMGMLVAVTVFAATLLIIDLLF